MKMVYQFETTILSFRSSGFHFRELAADKNCMQRTLQTRPLLLQCLAFIFISFFVSGCFIDARLEKASSESAIEKISSRYFTIESAADGTGVAYTRVYLTDSMTKSIFAVERNSQGQFISAVSGAWMTGAFGHTRSESVNPVSTFSIQGISPGNDEVSFEADGGSIKVPITVEATPLLNFKLATQSLGEFGFGKLEVELSTAHSNPTIVNLETTSGTAIAGTHFELTSSTVTIPAGQTIGSVLILVKRDFLYSANRLFSVGLTTSNGIRLGSQIVSNITLQNNDLLPVVVAANSNSIALGSNYGCAVKNTGLYCWGDNTEGQIGNGSSGGVVTTPYLVFAEGSGVSKVSVSHEMGGASRHTCAIINGEAKCWGRNSEGQLGNGNQVDQFTPVTVSGFTTNVTDIAVGSESTCAIRSGALYCWGNGSEIKNNASVYTTPTSYAGIASGVTGLSSFGVNYLIIHSGAAKIFGGLDFSGYGFPLDNGGTSSPTMNAPTTVFSLTSGVTDISVDTMNGGCAVAASALYCWSMWLGVASGFDRPVAMTAFTSNIQYIARSSSFQCASFVDQKVRCFDSDTSSATPTLTVYDFLVSGASIIDLIGSADSEVCAIYNTGIARCLGGDGPVGALVNASLGKPQFLDTNISLDLLAGEACGIKNQKIYCATGGVSNLLVEQTSLGPADTFYGTPASGCSLHQGKVRCWGPGDMLGDGVYATSATPVNVSGLSTNVSMIAEISYGGTLRCAIQSSSLYCWRSGTLPTLVTGLGAAVASLSSMYIYLGVTMVDGSVKYLSSTDVTNTPATFTSPPSNVIKMTGIRHSFTYSYCYLTSAGSVYCATSGYPGLLGDGTTGGSATPLLVPGLTGVFDIFGDGKFACARTSSAIKCWGDSPFGTYLVPTSIPEFPTADIKSVLVSTDLCLLDSNSRLFCSLKSGVLFKSAGNGSGIYPFVME